MSATTPSDDQLRLFIAGSGEGRISVVDRAGLRALHFSSPAIQSLQDPQAPEKLQLDYTIAMALATLIHAAPQRVLLIGLGGGSLVHFIHHYFPEMQIDVIEKIPTVIQVARDYFLLPEDKRIQLYCGDAQQTIPTLTGPYDLIFNDAYSDQGPDAALYADELHQQVARLLGRQGVLVSNLWQRRIEDNLALLGVLKQRLPVMAYHKDKTGSNLVLFSSCTAWSKSQLAQRSRQLLQRSGTPFGEYSHNIYYGVTLLRWRLRLLRWMKKI
ncbi:MAG: hypothetical protein L3J62_05640 [Gammaproteobacteria bacterium]|nr:hypothetical protein [Gammaproteobacteria bacterium]MCF6230263.1 hypothetical protein [Gammaproteobacteria bacterium]